MNKKQKEEKVRQWFREGKIEILGNTSYSVPSEAFTMGITPGLVCKVIKGIKKENK